MTQPIVDIAMYHSIADRNGPTSVSPLVFAGHMAEIAKAGIPVIGLDDLLAAKAGKANLPAQSIILTFDDGFRDFAEVAFPILRQHGFPSIVYLPTAHIGRSEAWRGANVPARPLVDWNMVRSLAAAGVTFGSHTVSHPDLCSLTDDALNAELSQSRSALEARLGKKVIHFAPPYGRTSPKVQTQIANYYGTSVGTRLARYRQGDDLHDLPRLEMFYFTDLSHWRRHLHNQGGAYLLARQTLRRIRNGISMPWERP